MQKDGLMGIGIMLGTIIGAGFLALPYAAGKAGIITTLIFLAGLCLVITLLHIAYADVVLATSSRHRLPGYAKIYLGKKGKFISGISALVGQSGGLLVYLLVGGGFIGVLLPKEFSDLGTLIFWFILTILLLISFRTSALIDAVISWLLVIILFSLSFRAFGQITLENFVWLGPAQQWILVYGIAMFSLLGISAVPELTAFESLKNRRVLVLVLAIATIAAAILYAGFTLAVLGAVGPDISSNAFLDMHDLLPKWLGWILPFAGLIAIGTSYFTFGVSLKNVLTMDFGLNRNISSAIVSFLPFSLFLSGLRDIARIIGFLGGIWISIDAITILLMRERLYSLNSTARPDILKKKIVGRALMLIFIFGTISSIIGIK